MKKKAFSMDAISLHIRSSDGESKTDAQMIKEGRFKPLSHDWSFGMEEDKTINDHMEYTLPESLACSRRLSLSFDTAPASELSRKEALRKFQWRRMWHDGWMVSPSLKHREVMLLDDVYRNSFCDYDQPEENGISTFSVPPSTEPRLRVLHAFTWQRLYLGTMWIYMPVLEAMEKEEINAQISTMLNRGAAYPEEVREMVNDNSVLRGLLEDAGKFSFHTNRRIEHVVMIVVVEAEVVPILERLDFQEDEAATQNLMGLAIVRSGRYKSFKLSVCKVAESAIFHRHYSGYTQASAVAALACRLLEPSLIVSFGTAGGVPGLASVGDVVLAEGCLFLDRLRTRSKNAFDWGLWGGGCVSASQLRSALSLKGGAVASQIGYQVSPLQEEIIDKMGIACLDMEGAPIAQICNQAGVNLLVMKVISNGVYPGEPKRMESEYHLNREEVSRRATKALTQLFDFLDEKSPEEL